MKKCKVYICKLVLGAFLFSTVSVNFMAHTATASTFYEANTENATIGSVGLSYSTLGDWNISNLDGLTIGSNIYNFSAVLFTALETAEHVIGQSYAPVDTIAILYEGVFDPDSPGTNALVGNDDTGAASHRNALGDPNATVSCSSSSFCPQVRYNLMQHQVYTLFISTYAPGSELDLPFNFYTSHEMYIGSYLPPINDSQSCFLASELDITMRAAFDGGTLKMDQADATYDDFFTVTNDSRNTIDQNGIHSTFAGGFVNETAGTPGQLHITDSLGGATVLFVK